MMMLIAREAGEFVGAEVGNDGNGEVGDTASHGGGVLQHEAAATPVERAGDEFQRDVAAPLASGREASISPLLVAFRPCFT